jgi:hypothetical protein
MTTVAITIDSREVRNMLERAPGRINRALRAGMDDATLLLLREQKTYPPQRTGSTYRRTGTLGRSWSRTVETQGNTVIGEVGSNSNMAPYNRQVQDADRQSRIHRGRWTNTVQETARRNERTVQRYFDRRLREEFSR